MFTITNIFVLIVIIIVAYILVNKYTSYKLMKTKNNLEQMAENLAKEKNQLQQNKQEKDKGDK